MRRKLSAMTLALSLLLCAATLALWILPIRPWPNQGRGTFFISFENHQTLRLNIFGTSPSPVLSPPQEDTRAFGLWQMSIPAGPSFQFLGVRISHYPWFKGSSSPDGHNFLTHVGTHWSFDAPFLGLFLLFASPWILKLVILTWRHRPTFSRPGHCPTCNYNLTGNTSGTCPECGMAIPQIPSYSNLIDQ